MQIIFVFIIFYFLPYLLTTLLPAVFLPKFISKRLKLTGNKFSFLPFILPLITLPIIANILWEILLYKHVYYEWDRIFLPYNFFFYERPLTDGSVSWLAKGWTQWHLFFIWITITTVIYTIAYFAPQLIAKGKSEYMKVIRLSLLPFIVMTGISLAIHLVRLLTIGY